MKGTGMQEVGNVQNSGGRGVVSRSSLRKFVLAWRCRLFDCRGVTNKFCGRQRIGSVRHDDGLAAGLDDMIDPGLDGRVQCRMRVHLGQKDGWYCRAVLLCCLSHG